MAIKVIVNGASGKMGSLACQAIQSHSELQLVASLGRHDNLEGVIQETHAQVVVDLTRADCVFNNSQVIIKAGAFPVIGTSGLVENQIQILAAMCEEKHTGGIIVPNFSIAAVLMMRFAKEAAQFFPEVEIIEAHHQQKLDAPSGTALKTAEMISSARKEKKAILKIKELVPGARGALHEDVSIHSIRLPGVLAKQQVIFGNSGETLMISHETIDRASFMPGVVLACQKVSSLKKLYYGLEHILFS